MEPCSFEQNDIDKFISGDRSVFARLYNCYQQRMYSVALNFLGNADDALDAMHSVFLKLWDRKSRLGNILNIQAFLYITTRNYCLDRLRIEKQEQQKHSDYLYVTDNEVYQPDSEIYLVRELTLKKIFEIIGDLPAACKEVFELSYFKGMNAKEIAELKGISIDTVRVQKKKAVDALKGALGGLTPMILLLIFLWCAQVLRKTGATAKRIYQKALDIRQE